MSIRDIHYVTAIAEEKSFSKAAEKLFISQPALSQYIKRLEGELGCQLFTRQNHALQLTPAGQVMLQDGAVILRLYNQMLQKISNIAEGYAGNVRFGISPFYAKYYLPRILPTFRSSHPRIQLEVTEEHSYTLEEMLCREELDLCALPLSPENKLLTYEVILREEIFLAVPKEHPVNSLITPSPGFPYIDLKLVQNEPFVGLRSVQKFSAMSDSLCAEAGFQPNVVYETLNWDTVNMLIAGGLGVGFVPEIVVESSDPAHSPNYYRISSAHSSRPYAIAYRKGSNLSGSAKLLVEHLKNCFSEPAPEL